MNMRDIIAKKRYSEELTDEEIAFFIDGVTKGEIPDYQTSALLMAIVLNGMNDREMTTLTLEMANSGKTNDLSYIGSKAVDKHSTGGVGDKCTPIILPLVASFGIKTVKLSGRGLGFTGGTVDKFESIEGFNINVDSADFEKYVKENGMVISGQTPDLAPADKILYSLRDVTSTVDSIPLIASSIMSKKIAGGADAIVLDVTCGEGAFMKDLSQARELSNAMIKIGKLAGREVVCVITSMDEPLGRNVGNVLEMMEVFEVLQGKGEEDLIEVVTTLAAHMVKVSDAKENSMSVDEIKKLCRERLNDGTALEYYDKLLIGQGGLIHSTGSPIYKDYPTEVMRLTAPSDGYISAIKADMIGNASVELGAGRLKKTDAIDYGAGICIYKKIGDKVSKGDSICTLYKGKGSNIDEDRLEKAAELAFDAFVFTEDKPEVPSVVLDVCC